MTRMVQVVTGPMEGTAFLVVSDQKLSVGRSSSNDITLVYDPWISSTHLTLENDGDAFYIRDLASSNGTFVNGEKLTPHQKVALDEYFILGSTLCRVSEPGPMVANKPLSLGDDGYALYRDHPLVRLAAREARQRRAPVLAMPHLFLALLETGDSETERVLRGHGIDSDEVRSRLERFHFFEGEDQWINDFMPYQFRSKQRAEIFLTPQAQALLSRYGPQREYHPRSFLEVMLSERYTILFPLLGLSGPIEKPAPATERVTLPAYDGGDDLTLPGDFWSDLGNEIERRNVVILTGDKGTGKTAVLEQCFHTLPKVNLACFRDQRKQIFDPEMFLVYNEVADLVPYINTIIKALREPKTIAIDHFGTLLELMHQHNIEDTPLIRVLNRRKHATLLAVGTRHLERVKDVLKDPGLMTMDLRIKEANTEILDTFLRELERETRRTISARAERYLVDLLSRYNFTAAKSFLDFCSDRLRNLNYVYKELSSEQKTRAELSEAFFRYMNDRWTGTLDSLAGRVRDKEMDSLDISLSGVFSEGGEGEREEPSDGFALQLESLLNEILARNFRSAVAFSDQSRSLAEKGKLGPEAKQTELLRQVELSATAFRSGFVHWLKAFLADIDPAELRKSVGREPRVLWEEYLSRYELLDKRFVRDHFLEIARKVFLRKRREKPGKGPPDSLV